jgi:N-methylhydantoinase B/oxoprolinase/acetone carboxylase alpha subunit
MDQARQLDVVTFEVLRHRLWEINDEMGLMAARISGSPAVYESGDFNAALLTADGRGLFTGVYVIRQAAALDVMVRSVLQEFGEDIHDGDMFLTNDPWYGSLHAMDYAVVAPVFAEGRMVAWTGVTMHEMDVGGPRPGSWSVGAKNAFEECPLMPPAKIVDAGRFRKDVEAFYLRNSRTAQVNALNLRAKIAAQVTTRERLREIVAEYGLRTFLGVQEQIVDYVKRSLKKRIAALPDGKWYGNTLLQHDGVNDRLYELKLVLTKQGERMVFDFTGTAAQAPGSINCAYSGLIGGVTQVLFPLLCFDLPWSQGALLDCIEIISEPGTINNATYPAATSMATVNASQSTGNLVWEAMAKLYGASEHLRDEVIAIGYGGVNMAVLSGRRADGSPFVNMFTDSVGGGGARSFADGIDSCGNLIAPSYGIPNVERIESLLPLLYVYRKEKPDTAGAGKYRGGVSLEYMLMPHGTPHPVDAVFFGSAHDHIENKGVAGGLPSTIQRSTVLRGTDLRACFSAGQIPVSPEEVRCARIDTPQAKDVASLGPDDAWVNYCSGGGGYGDPLLRDPGAVERDLRTGLVSAPEAKRLYGLVLQPGSASAADLKATATERDARRRARVARGVPFPGAGPHRKAVQKEVAARFGEILSVRSMGGAMMLVCDCCETILGPAEANPRRLGLMIEEPISAVAAINAQVARPPVVVREYCCPGCGALYATDVQRPEEDPWQEDLSMAVG